MNAKIVNNPSATLRRRIAAVGHGAMPSTEWSKWTGFQSAVLRGFAFLLLATLAVTTAAAEETVLHSFNPYAQGANPQEHNPFKDPSVRPVSHPTICPRSREKQTY